MEVALVILSIVIGVIGGVLLTINVIDMLIEEEKGIRIKAFGIFLFCILIVIYTIAVMIYLPLPLA